MFNTSSDPQHFFETDAAQDKRARRAAKAGNQYGSPISLKSKVLGAVVDPHAPTSAIFVAESAGAVRRINLDNGDTKTVYRGPTVPVSCVCVGGPGATTVFAGSWDKAIWSWDLATKQQKRKYVGHSDFVKALVTAKLGEKDVLISGGSDNKILVWDIATGARLHTLQDNATNMMAVQDLAIDPVASNQIELIVVSASSDPQLRRWRIRQDGWEQITESPANGAEAESKTITQHETSIYKVFFDAEEEDVDLWTCSGDGTAKCLTRASGFVTDDSFDHGDHVRALAVTEHWVITAGRDEDVKFWDRSSGQLHASLQGHYDEITDLAVLGDRVCSVSIDGTVRTWPLNRVKLDEAVKEQAKPATTEEDETQDNGNGMMTAEEEAELAELMDD